MKTLRNMTVIAAALSVSLLSGCAAKHINPDDRDTTGSYDGVWIGSVAGPRAKTELLPGNWRMSCDWEPYEIYMVVDDGRVQLGRIEGKTAVSTDGDFRIDLTSGGGGMTGGVMPGNGKFVQIYSGNLAGDNARGKYVQFLQSLGSTGCNAKIQFRRQAESEA